MSGKMRAIVWTAYGDPDVLKVQEVEKPVPKDNEVLIRVHASTVSAGDAEMRRLKFPIYLRIPLQLYVGVLKPNRIKILGQELAGVVEAVGIGVTRFKVGDRVFGPTDFNMGAYAEYITLPEDGILAVIPSNMTFEEAAAVPVGGLNALHFLRKGDVRSGHRVLINGSGGSIGTIAVQLAKSYGADVTVVDSTTKMEMLRSIGADTVIDYTRDDFTRRGETYDVIFDVVGKAPYSRALGCLKEDGVYLNGNPTLLRTIRGMWTNMTSSRRVISETANYSVEDLEHLKGIIESGIVKTVIDRSYPLEEAADAHRFVENEHKKGNVVLLI